MLLLYRQGGRIVTVNVPVFSDQDRALPPPPEAYGRPWSQVPMEEKMAILTAERRRSDVE